MAERDGISRLGERVAGTELTDRLRHVADSLAVDLRDELPSSTVERLVFESADELLRDAVVHDFVPILAARTARQRARTAVLEVEEAIPTPGPATNGTTASPAPPVEVPSIPPEEVKRLLHRARQLRAKLLAGLD